MALNLKVSEETAGSAFADASTFRGVESGASVRYSGAQVKAAVQTNFTTSMFAAGVIDTDGTLVGNSDTKLATQKAVKTYADQLIAANDAMVFKGVIDASANPNYPAADRGNTYRISVAGKIGGASGTNVEAGDLLLCLTDGTIAGTQAAVGASWTIAQTNLDGAVIGPASVTDNTIALFSGTSGKLLKAATLGATLAFSGVALQTAAATGDVTWSANSFATTIGATKVTSAMLNADVYSTAHSWAGQQTLTNPIFTTPTLGAAVGTSLVLGTATLGTNKLAIGGTALFNINAAAAPTPATGTGIQLVGTDATVARYEVDSFGAIAAVTVRRANNTGASPTALASLDQIGAFNFHGYYVTGGPAYSGPQASIQGFATQAWTSTANGTKIVLSTTPNSSTTLTTALTIDQDQSVTFAGATTHNAAVTISGTSLTLSGNQSAAAWTTSGIRIKGVASTLTDTTSSGTVATTYTNVLGGNTIAASSATTFTNYFGLYLNDPAAGTNVTLTNKWALGVDSLKVANAWNISNANGHILAVADNSNDIGGAGANRPRDVYLGGKILVNGAILTGPSPAVLQHGTTDAASPVAQTIKVQGVVAGTSNTAGALWTFKDSVGTGTGASGGYAFQVAAAGSTGSTQNTYANALTINPAGTILVNAPGTASRMALGFNNDITTGFYTTGGAIYALSAGSYLFRIAGSGLSVLSAGLIGWSSDASDLTVARDAFFSRAGAASIQMGNVDAASPVAQTLRVQSVVAGTSNTAGTDFTVKGSAGTGTGAGGSIIFQVAPAGSTGTSQNAYATALTIAGGTGVVTLTANGALSAPGLTATGTWITGGSATTTKPYVLIEPTGTTSTGWGTGGTAFGINAASAYTGNLFDLQVGGSSRVLIDYTGAFATNGVSGNQPGFYAKITTDSSNRLFVGLDSSNNATVNFGAGSGARDVFIGRNAAATLQFGAANAASPVAQTLQAQGSRSGTDSDVGGANMTVRSGNGTGIGAISSLILQSPIVVASGTGAQTQTTGLTIKAGTAVLTSYAVSGLPAASVAGAGATAFVTDASTTLILGLGGTVTGGGANKVPVYSDGTNWVYG